MIQVSRISYDIIEINHYRKKQFKSSRMSLYITFRIVSENQNVKIETLEVKYQKLETLLKNQEQTNTEWKG